MNRSIIAEVMIFFFPLNPPMPPPLCFGDAREGTVGDSTPLAKHSERSVEHTPWIKHQALSSNQLCKFEHIETQSRADWAELGFGTRVYRDYITSYSEGVSVLSLLKGEMTWRRNGG